MVDFFKSANDAKDWITNEYREFRTTVTTADLNKDGKPDVEQFKSWLNTKGDQAQSMFTEATHKIGQTEKSLADTLAPVAQEFKKDAGNFFTHNKSAVVGFGILAVLGGLFGMGLIETLLMAVIGGAIFGAMGDKGGMMGGIADGIKSFFGGKDKEHNNGQGSGLSQSTGIPIPNFLKSFTPDASMLDKDAHLTDVGAHQMARDIIAAAKDFNITLGEQHGNEVTLNMNMPSFGNGKKPMVMYLTGKLDEAGTLHIEHMRDSTGKDVGVPTILDKTFPHMAENGKIAQSSIDRFSHDIQDEINKALPDNEAFVSKIANAIKENYNEVVDTRKKQMNAPTVPMTPLAPAQEQQHRTTQLAKDENGVSQFIDPKHLPLVNNIAEKLQPYYDGDAQHPGAPKPIAVAAVTTTPEQSR